MMGFGAVAIRGVEHSPDPSMRPWNCETARGALVAGTYFCSDSLCDDLVHLNGTIRQLKVGNGGLRSWADLSRACETHSTFGKRDFLPDILKGQ